MAEVRLISTAAFVLLCSLFISASSQYSYYWPFGYGGGYWGSISHYRPRMCLKYGEVYRVCQSSSCGERRCNQPWSQACSADCRTGCFCGPAFCRDRKNQCRRDQYSPPQNAHCVYTNTWGPK
uniref:Uncharacterized protein HLSG-g33 n=1 Tax=Haemaphysalis longicornis TaxID=44386 RepID=Q4R194_HAELO|nr:hypothetical protein [Haemaphysalis longicornis]